MLFYERVKKFEYKFNDTEDAIIDYILNNKESVSSISINSLAKKFFTVPNTIVRLAKKMDYDGFSQLKNSLKEEIKGNKKTTLSPGFELNIIKTLELIDKNKIDKVVDIINKSKRIVFYSIGENIPLCEMAVREFKVCNKNVDYYTQPHEINYEVNMLGEQDAIFLISFRGESTQVNDIARLAKSKGCTVISLTHICSNTLQSIADIDLYCYSPWVRINDHNITDKTPIMLILRCIIERSQQIY